jgi:hypothetical protein
LYVNSDQAISEDNLVPAASLGQPTQPGCANNWGDQWAGAGGNSNNPPACTVATNGAASQTTTYQYTASCPPGTRQQWSFFTYNTTIGVSGTGDSAEVLFAVATAPLLDGGVGSFTSYINVADAKGLDSSGNNIGDPLVCSLGGPAATTPATACSNGNGNPSPPCCPKSILAALEMPTSMGGLGSAAGKVAAQNGVLSLRITMNPSSDGRSTSTVNSFQVSYDCVPSE